MGLPDSGLGIAAYYAMAKSIDFLQMCAGQHVHNAQVNGGRDRSEQDPLIGALTKSDASARPTESKECPQILYQSPD
eukprot:3374358-Amphidinium_carterae.1